ncbi:MAG: AAA family ATPase, partial [Pseudomonadota bacterium]
MKRLPTIDFLMKLAAQEAIRAGFVQLDPEHLLIAVSKFSELDSSFARGSLDDEIMLTMLEKELQGVKEALTRLPFGTGELRRRIRAKMGRGDRKYAGGVIQRTPEAKRLFEQANSLAKTAKAPYLTAVHLLEAIYREPTGHLAEIFGEAAFKPKPMVSPSPEDAAMESVRDRVRLVVDRRSAPEAGPSPLALSELARSAEALTSKLDEKTIGNRAGIHGFVQGLSQAEFLAADASRCGPKSLFLFIGPPKSGMAQLARSATEILGKPFKRYPMRSFSDAEQARSLVGPVSWKSGSSPGMLTEFVAHRPEAFLVFSEIEKAHPLVIDYLVRIIDEGKTDDPFTGRAVDFRNTIVILTTHACSAFQDTWPPPEVSFADETTLRRALLDAVMKETDAVSGLPVFPEALHSRMLNGHVLLFDQPDIHQMERIAEAEMRRTAGLMKGVHGKTVEFAAEVPLYLALREGADSDPLTMRSRVESFVKTELFNLSRLWTPDKLEAMLAAADRIVFEVDAKERFSPMVEAFIEADPRPRVLLVADREIADLWTKVVPDIDWMVAADKDTLIGLLQTSEIDAVLLDLLVQPWNEAPKLLFDADMTVNQFDQVPVASRQLSFGREMLITLRRNAPDTPCFLVS